MLQGILSQAVSFTPEQTRILISMAWYSGVMLIVASASNFMYGYAGVPFLGNALPAYIGGMTVSAITTRITYIIVEAAGIRLLPHQANQDWMFNSEENAKLVNGILESSPVLCIALIMFTLLLSMVLGGVGGWLISRPVLRLSSTYLMIASLTFVVVVCVFGRNILELSGGTLGIHVPNLFAFYKGDRTIIAFMFNFIVVFCVFLFLRFVKNSPHVKMLRAVRNGELSVADLGKDVVNMRGKVVLLGSSLIAVAAALNSLYYSFVVEGMFASPYWMYQPLVMITVGGLGSLVGTILGLVFISELRAMYLIFRSNIEEMVFFPISFIEDILLSLMITAFLLMIPGGLIRRRSRLKPMLGYVDPSKKGRYDGLRALYIPKMKDSGE